MMQDLTFDLSVSFAFKPDSSNTWPRPWQAWISSWNPMNECMAHGMTRLLMERFNSTHEITLVEGNGQRQMDNVPAWFNRPAHLDQLLAVWEWRSGPTPWLVMKAKS
jgi:hypothetical protein